MAIKTTAAAALQRDHRRRFRHHAMIPLGKHCISSAARCMAEKRIKHDQYKTKKQLQQQRQQQKQEHATSIEQDTTATPEPSTPPSDHQDRTTTRDKQSLQHILGQNFDDKDRSAADILATLYQKGLLDRQTPAASECSVSGTTTPVCESDLCTTESTVLLILPPWLFLTDQMMMICSQLSWPCPACSKPRLCLRPGGPRNARKLAKLRLLLQTPEQVEAASKKMSHLPQ